MAVPAGAELSDEDLMLRVGADDTDAFERLYDRYASLALRVARSVCVDARRAEEATEEAFLEIWRGRAGYRAGGGSVKAWALTVVRRRALDLARRDGAEGLHGLMKRLPDAQAEVIALAFFGGLTHTEIADRLSLPEGTVKGRMRLGMHKLRDDMDARDALAASGPPRSPS